MAGTMTFGGAYLSLDQGVLNLIERIQRARGTLRFTNPDEFHAAKRDLMRAHLAAEKNYGVIPNGKSSTLHQLVFDYEETVLAIEYEHLATA
ncbi:MAG: hypothetical protein WCX71_03010 [Candidatus Buchananbacteria bacterium]